MKNIRLALIMTAIFIAASASFGQSRIGGRVVSVIDGKTVSIEMPNGSRLTAVLQYVEVPEPEQPLHKIAAEHLSELVLGKKVEFRARSITPLKTAGYLFFGNVDIGQQMIRDGAAWYAVPEKSGQEAAVSVTYQSNEALAKAEKRGIWSVADLKPSWEIRAEAEEDRRRQEEKRVREAAELAAKTAAATPSKPRVVVRQQLNSESQMLATSNAAIKLPANMKVVGDLLIGYEPSLKLGVVATPLLKAEFAGKNGEQTLAVQIAYLYYDADESKGRQSVYIVGIDSESKDFKFLADNNLILTADNQKIVVGKAKRVSRKTDFGVKESLVYEIKKNVFTKIANARSLEIKVGGYTKNTNSAIQRTLQNLLQTSL